jgi:hypothetical protein
MEAAPPGKSTGREIVERTVEAGLNYVPLVGPVLAITFVTAMGWNLDKRRDEWFTKRAEGLEEVRGRIGDFDFQNLPANDIFVDAVITASRTIEHTHQEEKITALRNAVLNSVAADAPDADTQAIFLNLIDRFTPSHLRMLTLWDDPEAWFESHGLTPPQGLMAGARTLTVEAGMPEMRGRKDFYLLVASDLMSAGLMTASLPGMVTYEALMNRLTNDLGRQLVRFISPPAGDAS